MERVMRCLPNEREWPRQPPKGTRREWGEDDEKRPVPAICVTEGREGTEGTGEEARLNQTHPDGPGLELSRMLHGL